MWTHPLLTCEPQHQAGTAVGTAIGLSLSSFILVQLLWLCAVLASPVSAAFLAYEGLDILPYQAREKQGYLFQSQKRKRLDYIPEIHLRRTVWPSGQRLFAGGAQL